MIINNENIKTLINPNRCAKQDTIAIIVNNNKAWIGSNWCENPLIECPRKDLPTGVGYELCKDICKQHSHAEVDACLKAGLEAEDGTLYLIGHTYCCDNCLKIMKEYGITNIVIGKFPTTELEISD